MLALSFNYHQIPTLSVSLFVLQEPSEKHLEEISRLQEEIEDTLQKQKPRGIWAAYASKILPL